MAEKKKRVPATPEETRDLLKKAVKCAPRPLPPGFFPDIMRRSEEEGCSRSDMLDTLDEWLNYGYCRIIDHITQDIEITEEGESFFYGSMTSCTAAPREA